MTYEYENKKQPETIQLRAEFKGNPKIFEVSIITYKITKGLEGKRNLQSYQRIDIGIYVQSFGIMLKRFIWILLKSNSNLKNAITIH